MSFEYEKSDDALAFIAEMTEITLSLSFYFYLFRIIT